MSRLKFTIVHPGARPQAWREIHDQWLSHADRPDDVQYVLVTDPRWGFEEAGDIKGLRVQDDCISNLGRRCYVDAVNTGALQATGDVVIVIADDQYPCEHWDTLLDEFIWQAGKIPDKGCVIHVRNGTPMDERKMLPLPIITRNRIDRLGYIFHPGYESMYADNDLYEHAAHDGVLIDARHLPIFPHRHPIYDATVKMDPQYEAQNRLYAYQLGETMLNFRRKTGFGNCEPAPRPMVLSVCLPGGDFSGDFMAYWTTLFAMLSRHYAVQPFFAYSSNVYVTRACLAKEVLEAKVKSDLILWIDHDNLVTFEQVQMLIEDMVNHPQIGSVAGWCNLAKQDKVSVGEFRPDGETIPYTTQQAEFSHGLRERPNYRRPQQVGWHGFPCVLMRPETLAAAGGAKAFMPIIEPHLHWGFSGEDIAFCRRATEAGHKLYVDWRVKVPHLKLSDCNSISPAKAAEQAA